MSVFVCISVTDWRRQRETGRRQTGRDIRGTHLSHGHTLDAEAARDDGPQDLHVVIRLHGIEEFIDGM